MFTSNEARRYFDLPDKPGGNELLVQMQDVPLSMAGKAQPAPASPKPADDGEDKPGVDADEERLMRQKFRLKQASYVNIAA